MTSRLLVTFGLISVLAVPRGYCADSLPSAGTPQDAAPTALTKSETDKAFLEAAAEAAKSTDGDALLPTTPLSQQEADAMKTKSAAEAVGIKEHDPEAKTEIKQEIQATKKEEKRKSVALALGGGGARGAAHIGVLRVLEREGIPIDYIVGNSMGAIIGGLYASGSSIDDLEEHAKDGSMRKAYMPGGIPPRLALAPLIKLKSIFTKQYAGLWSGERFEKYLREHIPDEQEEISKTKIPFSAVATNLLDGKSYRLSKGDLPRAMRASASLSPLLRPVEIDDKLYVDGGIRANLPAFSAKETGADIVIAVLVDEPLAVAPKERFRSVKNTTIRVADIVLAVTDAHQLKFADVIISPNVQGISILSNKRKHYALAIEEGEKAAIRALPQIRKLLGVSSKVAATEKPEF